MLVINKKVKGLRVSVTVLLAALGVIPCAVFARGVDAAPDLKPWRYSSEIDVNSGKKTITISSTSDYSGVGDLIITCTSGSSTIEFVSAKPISAKGKIIVSNRRCETDAA